MVRGLSLTATNNSAATSLVSTIILVCTPCSFSSRSRYMNLVGFLVLISFSTVSRTNSTGDADKVCASNGMGCAISDSTQANKLGFRPNALIDQSLPLDESIVAAVAFYCCLDLTGQETRLFPLF